MTANKLKRLSRRQLAEKIVEAFEALPPQEHKRLAYQFLFGVCLDAEAEVFVDGVKFKIGHEWLPNCDIEFKYTMDVEIGGELVDFDERMHDAHDMAYIMLNEKYNLNKQKIIQ